MTQILLIEKDENLRSVLKLNARKMFGAEVIEKDAIEDAISLVQLLPTLDLIVCRESINGGGQLLNFLETEKLSIPLLWPGRIMPAYQKATMVEPDVHWESLLQTCGQILGLTSDSKKEAQYEPVDCVHFLNITSLSLGCDVFIKLKKNGEDHFVKCLHSTDKFGRSDIEKYMKQGLKEFYIPQEHYAQFVNYVTNKLVEKLDSVRLNGEDRLVLTGESYKMGMQRLQSIGIDEFTVELVDASVKSIMTSVTENNALGNFLKRMKENPLSYAYANAYLTSLILHKTIERFDWSSPQMKAKLTYVAYFHNVSLKEERHMKIRTTEDLMILDLPKADHEAVLNHAMNAAKIVDSSKMIPDGVGMIIKEHHGAKNGVGFPETLSISIAPLSMMFLVVEDFVDMFLRISDNPTRSEFEAIFNKLDERYTKLTYAQTVGVLREMILKK